MLSLVEIELITVLLDPKKIQLNYIIIFEEHRVLRHSVFNHNTTYIMSDNNDSPNNVFLLELKLFLNIYEINWLGK